MPPLFDLPDSVHSGDLDLTQLGTQLGDVTFVVVDLETTGAQANSSEITEIGAVKSRAGERLGEFQSLVRPEVSRISPWVQQLTGISNEMVSTAPRLAEVLPSFLEFAHGAVLVAHNASFDIGFLRRACAALDYPWPNFTVLDTVKMSRFVIGRDEVPNHKLATLAAFVGVDESPNHRALADARATETVLQFVFERFANMGVHTLEELTKVKPAGWKVRQSKRYLADGIPNVPGVYMFVDGSNRVLYIGKSSHLHTRVLNYFSAGETRGRMAEMVTATQSVKTIPTSTDLEAQVREVRLIAELAPPYNRRSKNPDRAVFLKLTDEPFPRLSVSKSPEHSPAFGPFRTTAAAKEAKALLERMFPLKTCTAKFRSTGFTPCAAGAMGKCAGPCSGTFDEQAYAAGIAGVQQLFAGDPRDFVSQLHVRMQRQAELTRYEEAQQTKEQGAKILRRLAAAQLNKTLTDTAEIHAVRQREDGVRELGIVRYGRLAACEAVRSDQDLRSAFQHLALSAEHVAPETQTLAEETYLVSQWIYSPGTELFFTSDPLRQFATGGAHSLAADLRLSA